MRRSLLAIVLIALALPLLGWASIPSPWVLRWAPPGRTSFMLHRVREARAAGEPLELDHRWVPLDSISERMIRALLVAEDDRFRTHGGVDWLALGEEVKYAGPDTVRWTDPADRAAVMEALRYGLAHRSEIRGRSTITQQLAKNLFFTPDRSVVRKALEMVVAWRLEFWLSKDRILELYLNSVEFGPGIFGVEAAAQHYFGVSAANLTRFQAASLAATLPHPLSSNPGHRPARMAWRRDLIIRRLGGEDVGIPRAPEEVEVGVPDLEGPSFGMDSIAADSVQRDTIAGDTLALPGGLDPTPPDTTAADTVVVDTLQVAGRSTVPSL